MTNKITLGTCLLGIISITSCRKEYTCECKSITTDNGNTTEEVLETHGSGAKMSKKKNSFRLVQSIGGYTESGPDYEYKEECKLK